MHSGIPEECRLESRLQIQQRRILLPMVLHFVAQYYP
jgi:hypothetical protein